MPSRERQPPDLAARRALGANVRTARAGLGISQETLAHESGIARSYVSNIERGLANPALDHLVMLARTLKVEPTEIVPTFAQVKKHTVR